MLSIPVPSINKMLYNMFAIISVIGISSTSSNTVIDVRYEQY